MIGQTFVWCMHKKDESTVLFSALSIEAEFKKNKNLQRNVKLCIFYCNIKSMAYNIYYEIKSASKKRNIFIKVSMYFYFAYFFDQHFLWDVVCSKNFLQSVSVTLPFQLLKKMELAIRSPYYPNNLIQLLTINGYRIRYPKPMCVFYVHVHVVKNILNSNTNIFLFMVTHSWH